MELDDETDNKNVNKSRNGSFGSTTTPLPMSDLFIRRSPPEGRLRNVRDSLSPRTVSSSGSPSPTVKNKRSPRNRQGNLLPELQQTPTKQTATEHPFRLTCETQLDFPRYKETWNSGSNLTTPIPSNLESTLMNSVLERRKSIKFQFMEGLEEELLEEEDSDDEYDEDSIQTASSSEIELHKSLTINNMGYTTTLSPNSSLEIKRPDCKYGEDCSNSEPRHFELYYHPPAPAPIMRKSPAVPRITNSEPIGLGYVEDSAAQTDMSHLNKKEGKQEETRINIPNSSAYTVNDSNNNNTQNNNALLGPYSMQGQSLFKNRYHVGNYNKQQQQKVEKSPPAVSPSSSLSSSPPPHSLFQNTNLENLLENLNAEQLRKLIVEIAAEKEIDDYIENKLVKNYSTTIDSCSPATVFQWNEGFQKYIENIRKLSPNTHMEERIKVYEDLAHHASDFIYTATTYGKIIIAEVYLHPSQKTIKPIWMEGRGVAGGEKYLQRGIYFKFAVDSHNIYQEEESVAKVAGHELKSLDQLFGLWMKGIHFPMMILIDYRGFRLIAMSTLPINENTIVYGSSDAGLSIHTDNVAVMETMKEIGHKLNLKDHKVGAKFAEKNIATPVDLEAHYGFDQRYYLLDFSRMFPPTVPDGTPSSYLFKLMRPEFVKRYSLPLCSDSFSNFIKNHNPEEHNKEIEVATEYLKKSLVKEFAESLANVPTDFRAHYPLVQSLHGQGINIRYIGLVRRALSSEVESEVYWRFCILLEIVTRTIKQVIRAELREAMRNLKQAGEEPYKQLVIYKLNLIFGDVPASDVYWNKELKTLIRNKFESALSDYELKEDYNLKKHFSDSIPGLLDGRCLLFKKLSAVLGLQWHSATMNAFCENPRVFNFAEPLDVADLELQGCVKTMNIAQHSEGFVIKLKASKRTGDESLRLYKLAIQKFEQSLESSPGNKVSLRNLADCYTCIGEFDLAEYYYIQAIKSGPTDTNTMFKYACFLERYGKYDLAEEYYLKALEAFPYHSNALTVYADFLASCRRYYHDAEDFYMLALKADETNVFCLNNYACFLTCVRKNYNQAEEYFKRAIEIDPDKVQHLQNYAIFIEKIRNNSEEALKWSQRSEEAERKNLFRSFSLGNYDEPETTTIRTLSFSNPEDKTPLSKSQKRNMRRKKIKDKIRTLKAQLAETEESKLTDSSSSLTSSDGSTSSSSQHKTPPKFKKRKGKKGFRAESMRKRGTFDFLDDY